MRIFIKALLFKTCFVLVLAQLPAGLYASSQPYRRLEVLSELLKRLCCRCYYPKPGTVIPHPLRREEQEHLDTIPE